MQTALFISRAEEKAELLNSKPYDSLTVGQSPAYIFHSDNSLFILLSMWARYSPREDPFMLAAQSLTMTLKTKHPQTKRQRTDNAANNQCQYKQTN